MKRNVGLDWIKGICIILVIVTHTVSFSTFPDFLSKFFGAIFLNLFFGVNGWLMFNNENSLVRIKNRFENLLFPYIGFSVITIIWHIVIVGGFRCTEVSDSYFGFRLILRDVFCAFSGLGIGTLWFLPVLFLTYCSTYVFLKISHGDNISTTLLFVVSIILIFSSNAVSNIEFTINDTLLKVVLEYREMFQRILYGTGYSIIGYSCCALYRNKQSKVPIFSGILILFSLVSYLCNNMIFFQITTCISILLLVNYLSDKCEIFSFGYTNKFITYFGENSLLVMVFHYNIILPVEVMFLKCIFLYGTIEYKIVLFSLNILLTFVLIIMFKFCGLDKKKIFGGKK